MSKESKKSTDSIESIHAIPSKKENDHG